MNPDDTCTAERAVYWNASGLQEDLNVSPLIPASQSRVNAMTDEDANGGLILVGQDSGSSLGVVWFRSSSSNAFTPIRSTDMCIRTPDWQLERFTDINANGWIVGSGFYDGGNFLRAVLLIPDLCPADVNGDREIDASDMSILLGAWGMCTGCCLSDTDKTGVVDASDLSTLLGAWGSCDLCSEGFQSSQSSGSFNLEESLPVALQLFGFDNVPDFATWLDGLNTQTRTNAVNTFVALLLGGNG